MKKDCSSLVSRILVLLVMTISTMLVGCAASAPQSVSVRYTISLTEPTQKRVTVRAMFADLPSGVIELATPHTWGAFQNLTQQIRWIQVNAIGGQEIALHPIEAQTEDDPFERWQVTVPSNGSLSITYSIEFTGNDGPVPSFVQNDHALLLTRSLFVFPTDWLDQPDKLPVGVQVRIDPPEGWPIYAPWPSGISKTTYLPTSLHDLLDTAIAIGQFRGFVVRQDQNSVNLLLAPNITYEDADIWAKGIGQSVLRLRDYFGSAPDGMTNINVLAIVVSNDAPLAAPTSESLAAGAIAVRASPQTPPDLLLLREAANLWITGALRAGPPWSPAPEEAWRTIGWADYLVSRLEMETGHTSTMQYWNNLRRMEQTLASNTALNTISLNQAAAAMHTDPLLYALVRDKGHLGALLLDERIRSDSGNTASLGIVLRQLLSEQNTYQTGAYVNTHELLQAIGAKTGADYTLLLAEITTSLGTLDLKSVPQFAGPPVGETRATYSPDGVQLVYQWLDGPSSRAAIYLEGGPGVPPYAWMYSASEALLAHLDVAYLDQRGCGRSSDPGPSGYTTDAFVNDIETLREALGVGQITLIGHDWGGYLALTYAARYPERVASLILISPIPSFPQTVQSQTAMLSSQITQYAVLADDIRALQEGVRSFEDLARLDRILIATKAYGSDLTLVRERHQAAYAHYGKVALLPPGLSLENTSILPNLIARDRLLEREIEPGLARAQYPVLILHGERDNAVGAKFLNAYANRIGAQVRSIAEAGHYAHIEQPQIVLDAIIAFLQSS